MAVHFNGSTCCNPQANKAQFGHGQKTKFGHAPQGANLSQRAGAPGQVQFGIVDGGVVSGPCSCVACCCAPFLAIPVAILTWVIGKKAFKGLGSLGGGLSRGIRGLGNKVGKKGGNEAVDG